MTKRMVFEHTTEPFKPDYDTEAVLVEEMQRLTKQLAEMQDWEGVAADQAMTIAMMKLEQEPVAYIRVSKTGHVMACAKTGDFYKLPDKTLLYTTPPQRTWATLTEEEILDLFDINNVYGSKWIEFARCVESKLKQKNNYAEEMNA